LYFSRFLLGAAEAGFMPGAVLYLTYWFPASRRAQITSWFFIAIAAAGIFGGPISGSILKYAATWGAMKGWQWLFVVEGIPATALGVFAYFYLQDRPQDARWLSNDEKSALLQDLEAEQAKPSHSAVSLRDIIKLPRIYAFGLAYFAIVASNNTLAVWAPTMIKDAGVRDVLAIGALSAIPYIVGAIGMHFVARHSDETGERRWHFVLPFMTTTIGFALIGFFRSNIFETIALSQYYPGINLPLFVKPMLWQATAATRLEPAAFPTATSVVLEKTALHAMTSQMAELGREAPFASGRVRPSTDIHLSRRADVQTSARPRRQTSVQSSSSASSTISAGRTRPKPVYERLVSVAKTLR
jgi:MFS family permease